MPLFDALPDYAAPQPGDLIPVERLADGATYKVSLSNLKFVGGAVGVYTTAGLPQAGTAGNLYLVSDGLKCLYFDNGTALIPVVGGVYVGAAFGIKADGSTDNNASSAGILQTVLSAINASGGGELWLPGPGNILFSTALNLQQFTNIRIRALEPGNQSGTGGQTNLRYTGTGSTSPFQLGSARAVEFSGLGLQWNNSGFTGYLCDCRQAAGHGNTTDLVFRDCTFSGTSSGVWTSAAALFALDGVDGMAFDHCRFQGGNYNVVGLVSSANECNTISFVNNCNFQNAVTCAIKNPHQNWVFQGCIWEPINSTVAAGAITFDTGFACRGLTLVGCWLGDDASGITGTWITLVANCTAVRITGCVIGVNSATTGIKCTGTVNGLEVKSWFNGGASPGSVAFDFTGTSGHTGVDLRGSGYNSITTQIAGISNPQGVFTSAVYESGGSTVLVSPTYAYSPNLMTAVQADFETGTGFWGSNNHATVSQSTAASLHGSACLQNAAAAGVTTESSISQLAGSPVTKGLIAVTPGTALAAQAWFLLGPGSTSRTCVLDLVAYDTNGANGTLFANSAGVRDSASLWQQQTVAGTFPATVTGGGAAVYLGLIVRWQDSVNLTAGEIHYMDQVSVVVGTAAGPWMTPGNPSLSVNGPVIQPLSAGDVWMMANSSSNSAHVSDGSGYPCFSARAKQSYLRSTPAYPLRKATGATTVAVGDYVVECDASAGGFTATLAAASSFIRGSTVVLKKIDSSGSPVTIAANGSDLIDGAGTLALLRQYDFVVLVSDGVSSWLTIAQAQSTYGNLLTTRTFL